MRKIGSGSMGRGDHVKSDAHHPRLFIEAKNRKSYAPVINCLAEAKKSRKGGIAALIFPQYPTPNNDMVIAVHSADLLELGYVDCVATSPYDFANRCYLCQSDRIRSEFKDLEDAEALAETEGKHISILTCKKPRSKGFVIVMRQRDLRTVCAWRLAGSQLVSDICFENDAMEHADFTPRKGYALSVAQPGANVGIQVIALLAQECFEELKHFDHQWQIPKKRKVNEREPETASAGGESEPG